jgi:hypothetical protein
MSSEEAEAIEAQYAKKWADEERRNFFSRMERKYKSKRSTQY